MTVIAAKKFDDCIRFAADSMISSDNTKHTQHEVNKIFHTFGMTVGGAGNLSEINLLKIYAKNRKPKEADEISVIEFFLEFESWAKKKRDNFIIENEYIIALENKLFNICDGYEVYEVKSFHSIGVGADFAIAILHTGGTPLEAVRVACDLCVLCGIPILELVHTFTTK